MKRERNMAPNRLVVSTKRKAKKEVEKVTKERRDATECVAVKSEVLVDRDGQQQVRLWSMADEQMSWGSFWCPSWDMEYLGEAYNALYSDVVWDDDIWDLKGIKKVPNP